MAAKKQRGAAAPKKITSKTTKQKTDTSTKKQKQATTKKLARVGATVAACASNPSNKRPSLLDAAAAVLQSTAPDALPVREILERLAKHRLWAPRRGGKTPHSTLAAAIAREIKDKGAASRFKKTGRGLFAFKAVRA